MQGGLVLNLFPSLSTASLILLRRSVRTESTCNNIRQTATGITIVAAAGTRGKENMNTNSIVL